MRVTLHVRTGSAAGKTVVLQPADGVTVGRGPGSGLMIADDRLLAVTHFRVVCRQNECLLEDLKSGSGTALNGVGVTRATLLDGDRISAGEALVDVTIEEPAADATATSVTDVLHSSRPLFAILDAARNPSIVPLLEEDIDCEVQCLYDGASALDLADFAPYLVSLPPGSELLPTLLERGWGDSWGVYLVSRESFAEVRRHLRRFLIVQRADGREAYFRFYDPRVLRVYLEECKGPDVRSFFGPVESFLMEADRSDCLLRFTPTGEACERETWLVRRL